MKLKLQMKKDGDVALQGTKSLGLEKLHKSIVGRDIQGKKKVQLIFMIYTAIILF